MSRKKKDGAEQNGTAVADPPVETPLTEPSANGHTGDSPVPAPKPNRPAASFAAHSDRTTRVEVAVWSKVIKVSEQEEYTQYALTLSRSWRDKDGQWHGNASFRIHDIPVLLYLVQQAYNWCVAQRTEVHIESNGDVPF
jgi:hypothetical protein